MVFDIGMKDFWIKANLLVGNHMTHAMDVLIYSIVNTSETVCIALTMAALHDQEVKALDVLNAYVMASNKQEIRVWG